MEAAVTRTQPKAEPKKPGPSPAFGGVPLKKMAIAVPEATARQIMADAALAGLTLGEYVAQIYATKKKSKI